MKLIVKGSRADSWSVHSSVVMMRKRNNYNSWVVLRNSWVCAAFFLNVIYTPAILFTAQCDIRCHMAVDEWVLIRTHLRQLFLWYPFPGHPRSAPSWSFSLQTTQVCCRLFLVSAQVFGWPSGSWINQQTWRLCQACVFQEDVSPGCFVVQRTWGPWILEHHCRRWCSSSCAQLLIPYKPTRSYETGLLGKQDEVGGRRTLKEEISSVKRI